MTITLDNALNLFAQSTACQANQRLIGNVQTAIRIYVIPYLSLPSSKFESDYKDSESCWRQIYINDFIQADVKKILTKELQAAVKSGAIKLGTEKNYRCAVVRFIKWLSEQSWPIEQEPEPKMEMETPIKTFAPVPIESRMSRLPQGRDLGTARRGKRGTGGNPYSLKLDEFTPHLNWQIEAPLYELNEENFSSNMLMELKQAPSGSAPNMGFHYFWTAPAVAQRKDCALREVTYKQSLKHIRGFLGWYGNIQHIQDKQELSLELLADLILLAEYIAWGITERGNGYGWAHQVSCSALHVIKWLHHRRSKRSNYKDIEAIELCRNCVDELHKKYQAEGYRYNSAKNLSEKLLTFAECQQAVKDLKSYCADTRAYNRAKRPESAVMASWQRYLIIAILTYCPIRQSEIRHLQFNVNLFREADGYWIRWSPAEHKTGSKTGKSRDFPLMLPEEITADLDIWIQQWQPKAKEIATDLDKWLEFWIKPNDPIERVQKYREIWKKVSFEDNLVFFSMGSRPCLESFGAMWTASHLGGLVTKAIYRLTGQRTSPHIFRNIAITHQRQHGDPAQRIALAEVMGHDPLTADKIYDLTSSRDRSKKAKDWWNC